MPPQIYADTEAREGLAWESQAQWIWSPSLRELGNYEQFIYKISTRIQLCQLRISPVAPVSLNMRVPCASIYPI